MKAVIHKGSFRDSRVMIPGSKSIAHRMLICAALADGISRLESVPESEDTAATKRVLETCGASFAADGNMTIVSGAGKNFRSDGSIADCGESGSTLRFLIPLLVRGGEAVFRGSGRLMERPLSVYEEIFAGQSLRFERKGDLLFAEGPLQPGNYRVKGNVSSQFISGLLFALPLAEKDSVITVEEPFESAAYTDLTTEALRKAGVPVKREGCVFFIPGGQTYGTRDAAVQADDSQAVFFAALARITEKRILLPNMSHVSLQADRQFLKILRRMGMRAEEAEEGYLFSPGDLKGCEIDLSGCPDLGPMLFALASQAEGETVFRNAGRLRIKESDRIAAMEEELRKLGCMIRSDHDTVYVRGKTKLQGGVTLEGHNDHRVVMALSILACGAENPCVISGAEAVRKSWPGFFRTLSETGAKVELC